MVLVAPPLEVTGGRWRRRLAGGLGDIALALLLGALFPFVILAIGAPVALLLRGLVELVNWF